tara:strand:+ start:6422 stop:7978 length:1557 start_codon:yes stop_codon:yes gene_type:complete
MPLQKKTSTQLLPKNSSPIKTLKKPSKKTFNLKQLPQEINITPDIFKKDYPLDKVIVEQDEDMNYIFYYKVDDNKVKLNKTKIGGGASGIIYEIKQGPYSFTVKDIKKKKEKNKELAIIKQLNTKPILCNVVNSHIITYNNQEFIVMDRYDGPLSNFLHYILSQYELMIEPMLDIFKQIVHDVYCLYTNGLYYTDLKIENILYKITGNSTFKLSLGDIGSICKNENENKNKNKNENDMPKLTHCVKTFYPPEALDEKETNESTIVWNLGIILLELLFISKYPEGSKNIDKLLYGRNLDAGPNERWPFYKINDKPANKQNIKEDHDAFMKQLKTDSVKKNSVKKNYVKKYFNYKYNGKDTIYDLIQRLLEFDYTKRISLKEVCIRLGLLEVTEQKGRFLVTQDAFISNSPRKSNKTTQKVKQQSKTQFTISIVPEKNLPPDYGPRKKQPTTQFTISVIPEKNLPPDYGPRKNPTVSNKSKKKIKRTKNQFIVSEVKENPSNSKKRTQKKSKSPVTESTV